jgi:bifunctional oligoribonuclease and PAP phosphatase NrnA
MELHDLQSFLRIPRDIAVVSHRNPDGDAVGSCLAVGRMLEGMGHTVHVFLPSEYPLLYGWLPGIPAIRIYDLHQEEVLHLLARVDLLWMLDFNAMDRIDKIGEAVHEREDLQRVLIDHHIDPEPIADLMYCDPEASSTCELVLDFFREMGWEKRMNADIAHCLMTGILTDTGSFKYNTRPDLFHKVADLMAMGVDLNHLQIRLFNNLPEKHLRLLGYCLDQRLEVLEEYHTAIISLSKEDYKRFDIQRGDTEGIVNYMLMIDKVRFAVFVSEQPTIIKLSFRSIGDFSVQEFARDHFKGGGHHNAAGGAVYGTLAKTLEKIHALLPQYADKLKNAQLYV